LPDYFTFDQISKNLNRTGRNQLSDRILKSYIVTGATRGLGFSIAKELAESTRSEVVLAVRDMERGAAAAAEMGKNVSAKEMDMGSSSSVEKFLNDWKKPLAGRVNNAGVQIVDATRFTDEDGYEETFAINHLYAVKLTIGLLGRLRGGRALFIGSGTHNPKNRTATNFGFRGVQYETIKKCAEGLNRSLKIDQLGMDRYATSKFLNMVSTVELARRISPDRTTFYCLDPGLMPVTGLARTAPAHLKFAWKYILPIMARFMPDTSTPARSGQAGAWLMTADCSLLKKGGIYAYDRKPSTRVWEKVFSPEIGLSALDESLELLGRYNEILN
jgi:NAD(P)-dependent dehydrogenase (short-subunit alcohol dehydrogenase family)